MTDVGGMSVQELLGKVLSEEHADPAIGDAPLGVDGPSRSPLRPPGWCHDALGDESIEDALATSRYDACGRASSVRYDDLVAITHPVEVAA